jgi:hypothetical protein
MSFLKFNYSRGASRLLSLYHSYEAASPTSKPLVFHHLPRPPQTSAAFLVTLV